MSNGDQSCNGGLQLSNDVKENDNRDVELLEDFDSYWQDINDRVVSDTVIKSMVQEATEKIADKELEVTKLKEMLHVYHVGVENEFLASLAMHQESNRLVKQGTKDKKHPSSLEAILENDRIEQSLSIFREATTEQFKKLMDSIRGCNSQLLGKVSDRWIDVDGTLNCLKSAIETGFQQVEQMVRLSKADVREWQQEQEFKAEIEAFVMWNCIWSVEENIWDRFYGDKNVNGHGRMKERISSLRQELDTNSKSLSVSDFGQLCSHGSLEGDEESNNFKKGDRPHRKVLTDLKSSSPSSPTSTSTSSSSIWEENGKHDESVINMSRDELINYYNTEMTKLKRNHESKVQNMTEQLFSLKRELLKERAKKNKEFDMLRRRISEVISKLDMDEENETFQCSLKDRLESLLSENHQLRDSLTDKKREIKCLSLQVSEAAATLEKEKKRYELAAQELENLRGETFRKQKMISRRVEVSKAALRNLVKRHKAKICKLYQKLELAMKELEEVKEERRMLLVVNQEKQNAVSLFEAKERELKQQLESIAVYSCGLLKAITDFESRVTQDISGKSSRLKSLSSQTHSLKQRANVLVSRGFVYKQRFEKKCSDLEKAEAEITEILMLIRRKLHGETEAV